MPGEHLTLRIFNPFPEPARSPSPASPTSGSRPSATWRASRWGALLAGRGVRLPAPAAPKPGDHGDRVEGVVVPAMVLGNEADEDWWPEWGRPPSGSSRGEGCGHRGLPGGAQPGPGPGRGERGPVHAEGPDHRGLHRHGDARGPRPFRPLRLPGRPMGARVVASGRWRPGWSPWGRRRCGDARRRPAGLHLAAARAARLPLHAASIWLLNTSSEESIAATVSALGGGGSSGETVVVVPGCPGRWTSPSRAPRGSWSRPRRR